MFKGNIQHETGVKSAYLQNRKGKPSSFKERGRLRRRGAFLKYGNKHLDRKARKCYPRGASFYRMVDLCTTHYMCNS